MHHIIMVRCFKHMLFNKPFWKWVWIVKLLITGQKFKQSILSPRLCVEQCQEKLRGLFCFYPIVIAYLKSLIYLRSFCQIIINYQIKSSYLYLNLVRLNYHTMSLYQEVIKFGIHIVLILIGLTFCHLQNLHIEWLMLQV